MAIEKVLTTMLTENGSPKARMLESKKIDVVEYLGKLGKIFSTVIKSSKWSDKVVNDVYKEYTTVEKYLKSQLKADGKETVDVVKKKKRWCAKKFFLTISKTDAPKEDVVKYYVEKMNICKAAGAQEFHKDCSKHLHIYLEFTAKKDIKNADYFNLPSEYKKYGNVSVKIDTIKKRTKENVYSYMLKSDKNVYSYGFDINRDVYGKLKPKEIWYKYATGEWSFGDIVKYDPSYLQKNLRQLYDRVTDNMMFLEKYFAVKFEKL